MRLLEAESCDEAWRLAASLVADSDDQELQEGRGGRFLDLGPVCFSVRDPRRRWVTSRRPAMNPAFALVEAIWILAGRDDAAFVNFFNPALPRYAGYGERYTGAYGRRLRTGRWGDQLERAYRALSAQPHSRQVVLQVWDPSSDLPGEDGQPAHADVPCNLSSALKLRAGRLDWVQTMRGNDLFLGTPHNFVQWTMLQEVMAGWLGMEVGEFCLVTSCLHVYERDLGKFTAYGTTPIEASDQADLRLDWNASKRVLDEFAGLLDWMVNAVPGTEELVAKVSRAGLPLDWADLLRVVAADAAERLGSGNEARILMAACKEPILQAMWSRWDRRQRSKPSGTEDE